MKCCLYYCGVEKEEARWLAGHSRGFPAMLEKPPSLRRHTHTQARTRSESATENILSDTRTSTPVCNKQKSQRGLSHDDPLMLNRLKDT